MYKRQVYFFGGDQDPVGGMGTGVPKVAEQFRQAGLRDVTVKLYPGGRHEMFNETNAQEAVSYTNLKEETRPWVGLRVVYVDRRGKERACFEETWTAERCQALFDALAEAYLARERIRRTHVLARNGSLASLRFPFAAYRAGQREMAVQVYRCV